jgi:octaprenyl-diphosphate synthase
MLATESSTTAAPALTTSPSEAPLAWRQIIGSVEPFLEAVQHRLAEQIEAFDAEIAPLAEYALTNQGKQLRPMLVALGAGATGRVTDAHVTAAVVIEMVHLATLVHDDVIDEAQIRRSRPTLAANWGNEISVLLGDCLFAHALKLAASFPTPDICRAVATSTNTVCSGEILQTQREKHLNLGRAEYFKILQMKTGELFALSCELGAFLNKAAGSLGHALRQYGLAIGTAYQIYDDCVDLFGSEDTAGKSLGSDLAKGKLTLPMLILLERASANETGQIRQWVQAWEPRHYPTVAQLLKRYRVFEASCAGVNHFLDAAQKALKILAPTESRAALLGLTDLLAQQTQALAHGPASSRP